MQGFPLLKAHLEQRSKSSRFLEYIGHQRSVGLGGQAPAGISMHEEMKSLQALKKENRKRSDSRGSLPVYQQEVGRFLSTQQAHGHNNACAFKNLEDSRVLWTYKNQI